MQQQPKPKSRSPKGRSPALAMALSLSLHALLFGAFYIIAKWTPKKTQNLVTIDFLPPEALAPQNVVSGKKIPTEVLNNQIVQQQNFLNNERDEKARFLSEKDQKVQKQTQAVAKGEFKNSQQQSAPKGSEKSSPKTAAAPPVDDLFKTYDVSEGLQRNKQKNELLEPSQATEKGSAQGKEFAKGDSQEQSQTNDYLKNVDQGLQTLLSTREFKYYSYYDRIRRQLAQHWEGKVREKLTVYYRKNRAPASTSQDRITKVIVILNSAGNLVRVQVVGVSGIQDLDDAATEAFRAAAPFPNPPKGILEDDGTVKIRWDFVLEV